MRPKQKRMLSGMVLGAILVGSAGFIVASMNTKETGNAGSVLEQLEYSQKQYYVKVTDNQVKIMDYSNKKEISSIETSITLTEQLGIPYYYSNTEFYQIFKTDTEQLAILEVKTPDIKVTTFDMPQDFVDLTLDKEGVHILTKNKVERFNYEGESKDSNTVGEGYQKIARNNNKDILFKGEYVYTGDIERYLAGNVISVATDDTHIYVLNDFGSGKENNMLAKIRAADLYIEDIVSIRPKGNILRGSGGSLYIETPDGLSIIDKKTLKEDYIAPSPLKDLQEEQ